MKKTDMFYACTLPKGAQDLLPLRTGKDFQVDKFMRDHWTQRDRLNPRVRVRGSPGGGGDSDSTSNKSDAGSTVSRAATVKSTESNLDSILPWRRQRPDTGKTKS